MDVRTRRHLLACAVVSAAYYIISYQRRRRWWQRQLLRRRYEYSGQDFRADLTEGCLFSNFTRMSNSDFELLVTLIGPEISKQNTNFRESITVKDRLAVTLRFLASDDSYHSLMYLFKISKQSISNIVPEVCTALVSALSTYVKTPTSAEEWVAVADEYRSKWQFDHCLGALDGKHVKSPAYSGTEFYNYKGHFSIVLMALVDANYLFLYVDVGCQGRISDGGVFKNCELWTKIENKQAGLPPDKPLPGRAFAVPYVIVADDAFALHDNIMKPYPGPQKKGSKKRIFNYRTSRARRCSENAFGILSSVFRVLRKPMLLGPDSATKVVSACVYLHNFLRSSKSSSKVYAPPGAVDCALPDGSVAPGEWRNDQRELASFYPLPRVGRKASEHAQAIRDEYATLFVSEKGSVPWQKDYD